MDKRVWRLPIGPPPVPGTPAITEPFASLALDPARTGVTG
jgi:hypothetical protein